MTIGDFIKNHDLEKTLLMGYYGGGNYGDELLLEVMQNLLHNQGVRQADIAYMPYVKFARYHHDFGYKPFRANSIPKLLAAIMRNKHVIVGGGGIWGLDAKLQPLLMSVALLIARMLGKKVYLLGVGYYSSTNRYGHIGAWLAARAAHVIIARDPETHINFRRLTPHVFEDADIAWYLPQIDMQAYDSELAELERKLPLTRPTLFITLRRFSLNHLNDYDALIGDLIEKYPSRDIVVALMEPRAVYREGYETIRAWERRLPHVRAIDLRYNPVAFYLYMRKHRDKLTLISPQFHAMLTAHLAGVRFMPLVYDNKCQALLDQLGVATVHSIYDLQPHTMASFVDGEIA